jgi:hypothetical protein
MRIVAVGDRAVVVPQLEALGLGAIVEMDADGRRITHAT